MPQGDLEDIYFVVSISLTLWYNIACKPKLKILSIPSSACVNLPTIQLQMSFAYHALLYILQEREVSKFF